MTSSSDVLKWSAQLQVSDSNRKLVGDKITLPQSALEQLLAAAPIVSVQNGQSRQHTSSFDPFNPHSFAAERRAREAFEDRQQQLPQPLTFRIVNPQNGRAVYAGIREFSAEEKSIGLSSVLREALGLQTTSEAPSLSSREGTPGGDIVMTNTVVDSKIETVTVHAKQLPKGTYVKLRPLEAGYDPEDWKSLLERHLRDNFTTLTSGELLIVPGPHRERFRFLVDKLEPEGDGICIVDTDLEVDIEPLSEEQARETLNQKLAKSKRSRSSTEANTSGGLLELGREVQGQLTPGTYIDYQLKHWNRADDLELTLKSDDSRLSLDIFASPLSAHQRARPRQDEFIYGDLSGRPIKKLKLAHTNVELDGAELLNIAVHAWGDSETEFISNIPTEAISYTIQVLRVETGTDSAVANIESELSPDEVVCKNCRQTVPKRTLHLHEAFCYRNNVSCPKCSNVFLKNSEAWKMHWHCPHDEEHGNDVLSQSKHNAVFHPSTPLQCSKCDFIAYDIPILAHHKTSVCPGKEILCSFCHLVVPQQGPDDPSFSDPEVILSGLTPHELTDGARTTECHLCNKIVRLRDMKTHMRLHDRDRFTRPKPRLCSNSVCGRTIRADDGPRVLKEQLGLCNECFGPLYVTSYDPEGKMLRRRIERRLLQQMIGGCGKGWCLNEQSCKTGHHNVTGQSRVISAKDGLALLQPTMTQLAQGVTTGLRFCVDEASQSRRSIANMMVGEGSYELEWCVKALEEEKGDVGRARDWLNTRAPKIGEAPS